MAAVGANSPIVNLIVGLLGGVSVAVNVIIAGLIGRGDGHKVKAAVRSMFYISLTVGTVLMLFGMLVSKPLLIATQAPANVFDAAVLYLRLYCMCMPFLAVYNYGASILRSRGDTKRALLVLVIAGLVNTGLNLFFVICLHMGVAGVAVATLISNIISAVLLMRIILKEEIAPAELLSHPWVDRRSVKLAASIGIPAGMQGVLFSFSNMIIQAAINGFGADAIAGNTAAANFEFFNFYFISGFAQTAVTFVSQNYGAGNIERCRKATRRCLVGGMALSICFIAVLMIFAKFFLGLYSPDPNVIGYGLVRFKYLVCVHFLIGTYEITAGALRGFGYSMTPTVISVIGTCVVRPLWVATVFAAVGTMPVLLIVYPVSWVVTGIAMTAAYFFALRKIERKAASEHLI
ncbi:MAG: MATE family efflux transporter, partial [Lachnospiraceae bacterium]|nr:MATE family efflux transporter [Lachnospiraceae bacterium]